MKSLIFAIAISTLVPLTALANNTSVRQTESAPITTRVDAAVSTMRGRLDITSAAIGNNLSVDSKRTTVVPVSVRQDFGLSQIGRVTPQLVTTTVNVTARDITGAIDLTGVAIGNNLTVTSTGGVSGDFTQRFWGDSRTTVTANLTNVTGAVDITSAAIANNLSITTTGGVQTILQNTNIDPTSSLAIRADNVGGVGSLSSIAMSNNASVTNTGGSLSLTQANNALVNATASLNMSRVGDVNATIAGIGNNARIGF